MHWLIRLVFLPATRGAEVLYFNVIRPFVVKGSSRPAAPATSSFSTSSTGAAAAAPSSFERKSQLHLPFGFPGWALADPDPRREDSLSLSNSVLVD